MKVQRWRVTFSKTEAMRYTGHLDLILTWERTFRRSGLPLSYSEGYSPRPVINLAAPLPLGYISTGEIGDFWLAEMVEADQFASSLQNSLPPGLGIQSIEQISEIHGDKLPTLVEAADYSILIDAWAERADPIPHFLKQTQIPRERKGKKYDLRPLVLSLSASEGESSGKMLLRTTMTLLPGATGRPDELLRELGIPLHRSLICREKIHLTRIVE